MVIVGGGWCPTYDSSSSNSMMPRLFSSASTPREHMRPPRMAEWKALMIRCTYQAIEMAMDWQREDGRVAKLVGFSGVDRGEWGESPWIVLGRAGLC